VPADPLLAAADRDILEGGGERRDDEILMVRPGEGSPGGLAIVAFRGPVADGPLQLPQVLVVGRRGERRIADAAQQPFPILLDVTGGVGAPPRRPAVR